MANLRKRVAACDLTRTRPTSEDLNANEAEQEQLDNRPLLPKVSFVDEHSKSVFILCVNVVGIT